jgi:hypothetical protein
MSSNVAQEVKLRATQDINNNDVILSKLVTNGYVPCVC